MPKHPRLLSPFVMRSRASQDQTADLIARSLDAVIGALKILHDHPVPDTFLGRQPKPERKGGCDKTLNGRSLRKQAEEKFPNAE